jgi:hypothetical protein
VIRFLIAAVRDRQNRGMSRPSRKPALGQSWDSQIVTWRDIK